MSETKDKSKELSVKIKPSDGDHQSRYRHMYVMHKDSNYHLASYYLGSTMCCAVSVLKGLGENTPVEHILAIIDFMKGDVGNSNYGQTNILVFAYEHERNLQNNLEKAGFSLMSKKVTRRRCYEQTRLYMYLYTF